MIDHIIDNSKILQDVCASVAEGLLGFAVFHEQRPSRVAIVGDRNVNDRIVGLRDKARQFEIVGFFELNPDDSPTGSAADAITASGSCLHHFLRETPADIVVVDRRHAAGHHVWDLLHEKANGLRVVDFAGFWERETGRVDLQSLHPALLLFGSKLRGSRSFLFRKRVVDVLFASLMLVLTAWLFAVVAVLVKATSPGPVLFRQERVGLDGRTFTILKFRSMHVDAERVSGPMWAQPNDSRITIVGSFLRQTRIDELPQLWNILRGEMSLVGPRPEQVPFVEILSRSLPFFCLRHCMKPGLTGWAMVNTSYAASIDEHTERLGFDLFYLRHSSILFDLLILVRTCPVVLKRLGR